MKSGAIFWLLKGKLIEKRPCEKVSYVFAFALGALLYFGYLWFTNQYTLPISYLYLALIGTASGYIGVLYYRIMHKKKPYFIFNFWSKY